MNLKRLARLAGLLGQAGVGNFLLTSANDIFYYTGFRPSSLSFLLLRPRPKLFVPALENEAERAGCEVAFIRKLGEVRSALKKHKRVGFDESNLGVQALRGLRGVRLKPCARFIKQPRAIKEPGEIERIKEACRVTKKLFRGLQVRGTEAQVRRKVLSGLLKARAGAAFSPIVAAGPNGYYIHHIPGERRVKAGDMVVVDAGAKVGGYCSDMSRTWCRRPGKRQRQVMGDVAEIQAEVADKVEAGARFEALQKEFERLMKKRGYKVWHGIGHGVGLNVHEPVSGELRPGMVLTVEPGVYIKNFGGCRIEDTVLVRRGKAKMLTR